MAADPAQPSRDAKAVTVESGFGVAAVWHALPAAEVARRWETDPGSGLSETEAARRLARYGPNELEVVGRTAWYTVLLRQFTDILIIILVAAAAISLAVGDAADAVTILAIVLLNGGLGFAQEWQAERAMAALREMLSPRCTVRRDGRETEIETAALVPGDVVMLKIGDRVPADLRLFETLNLKIDEAALTGESLSVAKDPAPLAVDAPVAERACIAWMGTEISNGRGAGVVVATGMETEFGRIARLTQSVERETTPLQRKLGRLGRKLGLLSVAVSVLIAGIGWLAGKPLLEMFLTGVSLAVALVPEGLPAVVTITLALGIRAMVRRHALLRRLQAAETLGAASVICTDKTGTLTRNEMTVTRIWYPEGAVTVSGVGYEPEGKFTVNGAAIDPHDRPGLRDLLRTGLICNHATITKTGEDWRALGRADRGGPRRCRLQGVALPGRRGPARDGVLLQLGPQAHDDHRPRRGYADRACQRRARGGPGALPLFAHRRRGPSDDGCGPSGGGSGLHGNGGGRPAHAGPGAPPCAALRCARRRRHRAGSDPARHRRHHRSPPAGGSRRHADRA